MEFKKVYIYVYFLVIITGMVVVFIVGNNLLANTFHVKDVSKFSPLSS